MRHTIYDTLNELLLVLLLVFTPLAYGAVHPWAIAVFEVTAALMAFLWVLKSLSRGKFELSFSPVFLLFVVLIAIASLQLLFTFHVPRFPFPRTLYLWSTKTEILKLVAYAMIFLVTLNTLRTRYQIKRVMSSIVVIGFFTSIFYLVHYLGVKMPVGFINPDHFSAYLGMIIPLALGLILVGNASVNATEGVINTAVIASDSACLPAGRKQSDTGFGTRPLLFFFMLIMSAALFFTMSRGGMFSFIAALLFVAWLVSTRRSMKKKGWILWAIAAFIVLIIAWLGATPVMERILSIKAEIASRYFGGRLPIWQGTLDIIQDHPVFGTGLGTFNDIFPRYQPLEIIHKHYTYAHSDILELLSGTGIAGFALFLAAGLGSLIYLFRRYRKRHDPWVVGLSICVFGSLASIFIHSFTDFNLHIPANAILLTVILALFISILHTTEHEERSTWNGERKTAPGRKWVKSGMAFAGIILLALYAIAVVRPALAAHYASLDKVGPPLSLRGSEGAEAISTQIRNTKTAIRLDPMNAGYYYKLGKQQGKLKAYSLQLSAYSEAVALNPANSQYHQSLAWAYGRKPGSEYKDLAHREFREAIRYEPNYYYPYQVYAGWLLNHPEKGNIEEGVGVYRQAIALNPKLADKALADYFKIEKSYAKLKKILAGTPEDHGKIMTMLLDAGLWEPNEGEFNKDREAASYKYPYYKALSRYYEKTGDRTRSIEVLVSYLKIDPNCADAHFYVADRMVYIKPVIWQEIFSHYESALALAPENTFYREWYARHLFYAKRYNDAITELEIVVKKDDWNVELIRLLGDWYKSVGRIKDADAMYSEASRASEHLKSGKKSVLPE